MRRNWLTGFGLLVLITMMTGCNTDLKEQNALLTDENMSLRTQLAERSAALDSLNDELREKNTRIAGLERDLDTARQMPATTTATSRDPFEGIEGVTGSFSRGEVTATIDSDVLFDSGKATIKNAAKRSLDQVAQILKTTYSAKPIRVSGHTDTDPIKKSGYKSNYHLGFERAYAVREYLVSKGVSADKIYLASYGPNKALATKPESRRVDVVVVVDE